VLWLDGLPGVQRHTLQCGVHDDRGYCRVHVSGFRLGPLALMLVTVPIVLFKNAVRIVTISTLAAYVDRSWLDGPFHHKYGGIVFSIVGMTLFVVALGGLQKIEGWRRGGVPPIPLFLPQSRR
jgi:exosortase/archaeosortase family protein